MKLTQRDFEIVEFVLNMKFATASDIHRKFFKRRKDGGISNSEWYARERLRELQLEGYLTTVRYRFENKGYYVGTKAGYQLLQYCSNLDLISKPIEKIDVRTFEHDQKVMQSRLLLEGHENATSWVSDRQLKGQELERFRYRSSRDSTPDGVYKSAAGKIIAFEYEIAQKSKRRYDEKIKRYVSAIRNGTLNAGSTYDHVHIICEKSAVRNLLLDRVSIYPQYFLIESAEEFFKKFETLRKIDTHIAAVTSRTLQ